MAANILFDTATLQGVLSQLPEPQTGVLARYFTEEVISDDFEINFDVEGTDLKMAPFVHPQVPGQNVVPEPYKAKKFRPAYVKDRRPFTPGGALTRRVGERIGGEMSPADRLELAVAEEVRLKKARLDRRLEWMACQALLKGKVTVAGDYYPATVVDFGRDPALTVVKTAGNKWGDSGVSPIADLRAWSSAAEAPITEWVMTNDAFALLAADPGFKDRMNTQLRGDNTVTMNIAGTDFQLTDMGVLDGMRILVAPNQPVVDSNGTRITMLPARTVIGVAKGYFRGVRHFGAIQDVEAMEEKFQGSYYIKSWVEKDPSARIMLLQAAPLMTPYRPNATFAATV